MKRRLLLILVILAFGILASGVVWWVFSERSCPITQENYERIKNGMTESDVIAILGPQKEIPDGRYPRRQTPTIIDFEKFPSKKTWSGKDNYITVLFGSDNLVGQKRFGEFWPERTYFEKIRQWLGI